MNHWAPLIRRAPCSHGDGDELGEGITQTLGSDGHGTLVPLLLRLREMETIRLFFRPRQKETERYRDIQSGPSPSNGDHAEFCSIPSLPPRDCYHIYPW